MRKIWNRFDETTKLSIACIALYLSLYIVVDISEAIAMWLI